MQVGDIILTENCGIAIVTAKNSRSSFQVTFLETGNIVNAHVSNLVRNCCRDPYVLTKDCFVRRAEYVHSSRYDYSLVEYDTAVVKVDILCHEHGAFQQRPTDHLRGSGCPKCAAIRQKRKVSKGADYFINQAKELHGDSYNYSLVPNDAVGHDNVNIICKDCGNTFSTRLARHAQNGHGCTCKQINGFSRSRKGYLYLLADDKSRVKVGITNRQLKPRLAEINKHSSGTFICIDKVYTEGWICEEYERELLKTLSDKFTRTDEVFSGYTETFLCNDFEYVEKIFSEAKSSVLDLGDMPEPPKKITTKETPEQRRARLSAKTGVPVGVVEKYGRWYFQIITRERGKKEKKPLGSFIEKSDCIVFAEHYWETGELLNTRKNLMVYNEYGLYKGVTPTKNGKFHATVHVNGRNNFLGTFLTEEDAVAARNRVIKNTEELNDYKEKGKDTRATEL